MKTVLADLEKGQFVRTQVNSDKDGKPAINTTAKLNSLNSMMKGKLEYSEDFIEFDHVPIVSPNGDVLVEVMDFKV